LKTLADNRVTQVEEYFKSNFEQYKKFYELAIDHANKQIEEAKQYYGDKLSKIR
jgi:hypothetical protein